MKLASEGPSLNVSAGSVASDSQSCVFPAFRQSIEKHLACSVLVFASHQHDMLHPDLLPERLRHLVPHEQVHPERQIAFLERLAQVSDTAPLLRGGKDDQIEVGLRT